MKKYLIFVLLFSLTFTAFSQAKEKTTYYLIRHAEKDRSDTTDKNPELNKKGKERAKKWNTIFKELKVDAIYSTDYNRTLQTVAPIAKSKKLTVKKYHPTNMDMMSFLNETKGKSILIVGHSNTVPSFANKLIGNGKYLNMDDTDNDNLYLVTIEGDLIEHVVIDVE
ncbi:phosphoglycerate mutase family protein [Aureibaculum sp. 2210JD6-5]|uniref:SixA phosphatase family protein n=1 Tax=Aureibaculum sp. 2210JD6-5 TaxID=3103957 RepID=UPI002AAEE657|nr:phosphoglycerate mutase family protein [Aureibaculum sp. 2210JD6-5]MDY7395086.1 phosphoglycerate mutase family protein [Aureibaculum sp. 2210JD6-5]